MLTRIDYKDCGINPDPQTNLGCLSGVKRFLTILLVGILVSFLSLSLRAKNKEARFNAPPDKVYQAALETAERYYSVVSSDEKHRTFQFYLRQFFDKDRPSGWVCSVWIEQEGSGSRVTMNLITRGVVGWGSNADKFLKRVEEALK